MKKSRYWIIVAFSNIMTASLVFGLMIHIEKKEVRRRDELVMRTLFGFHAAFRLIEAERIEKAKAVITTNIEDITSSRDQFSPYGYKGWQKVDPKNVIHRDSYKSEYERQNSNLERQK